MSPLRRAIHPSFTLLVKSHSDSLYLRIYKVLDIKIKTSGKLGQGSKTIHVFDSNKYLFQPKKIPKLE